VDRHEAAACAVGQIRSIRNSGLNIKGKLKIHKHGILQCNEIEQRPGRITLLHKILFHHFIIFYSLFNGSRKGSFLVHIHMSLIKATKCKL